LEKIITNIYDTVLDHLVNQIEDIYDKLGEVDTRKFDRLKKNVDYDNETNEKTKFVEEIREEIGLILYNNRDVVLDLVESKKLLN
jgi:hypothetical protein